MGLILFTSVPRSMLRTATSATKDCWLGTCFNNQTRTPFCFSIATKFLSCRCIACKDSVPDRDGCVGIGKIQILVFSPVGHGIPLAESTDINRPPRNQDDIRDLLPVDELHHRVVEFLTLRHSRVP